MMIFPLFNTISDVWLFLCAFIVALKFKCAQCVPFLSIKKEANELTTRHPPKNNNKNNNNNKNPKKPTNNPPPPKKKQKQASKQTKATQTAIRTPKQTNHPNKEFNPHPNQNKTNNNKKEFPSPIKCLHNTHTQWSM